MMHKRICGWALLCATVAPAATWAAADDLKPFPAAEPGQQRFVIRVPPVEVPDDHKLELVVGKTMQVDCNRQFFGAEFTTKVAQGWGFDYHVVGPIGPAASTMMACPPGVPKRDEFVRANLGGKGGPAGLLRYNPKLPVVVYVPDGFELRYRVWRAGADTASASRE
jgi:ecotin